MKKFILGHICILMIVCLMGCGGSTGVQVEGDHWTMTPEQLKQKLDETLTDTISLSEYNALGLDEGIMYQFSTSDDSMEIPWLLGIYPTSDGKYISEISIMGFVDDPDTTRLFVALVAGCIDESMDTALCATMLKSQLEYHTDLIVAGIDDPATNNSEHFYAGAILPNTK